MKSRDVESDDDKEFCEDESESSEAEYIQDLPPGQQPNIKMAEAAFKARAKLDKTYEDAPPSEFTLAGVFRSARVQRTGHVWQHRWRGNMPEWSVGTK